MKNKEVQEQRMKGYFLQATKDLLKAEGLKSVNVRTIADRAGYSYTTMYNYFKDINDLVFLCVADFYVECRQQVAEHAGKQEPGIKRLSAAVKAYADFFIQYPGIFELFFLEKLGSSKDRKSITETIAFSLDGVCEEEWNYCISKGVFPLEQVELIKAQLRNTVLGLLLLYLNQRTSSSYTEFVHQLNTQINVILDGGLSPSLGNGKMVRGGDTKVQNSLISIKIGNNG